MRNQDWKKAVIVTLHKKNDRLCCDNYRGISLLPHCEKVIAFCREFSVEQKKYDGSLWYQKTMVSVLVQ